METREKLIDHAMNTRNIEGKLAKRQTKESLEESIGDSKHELDIVLRLKQAIIDYAGIYDYTAEENTSGLCLLLGQLEFSIVQRKQMLIEDSREFMELN